MPEVHVLVPAQRHVFSLDGRGGAEVEDLKSSADGFRRYKELQAAGKPTGMVAFPNTCLIQADRDYLVDPGLVMQGGPVFGALQAHGVEPGAINDVILTHLHFDHAEGLAAWPQRRTFVHRLPNRSTALSPEKALAAARDRSHDLRHRAGRRLSGRPRHAEGILQT